MEIETLPLVDRNVYTLLDLTPGVQSNSGGTATAPSGSNALVLGYPEQRTFINGGVDGGSGSVNYYLDGGINMTGLRNTGNILPNPDAIEEFRLQTNSYNAEYGRYASGVINVLTKSGTNVFHGSVFEFLRNTVFNANDWGSLLARAPFHRNQFGATLGGPIRKDKTFFFFSYSGLRQATSTFLNNAIVPTALERTGNFSASTTKPTDPATGTTFVCNGVTGVICPSRLDPVAMKIINTYIPQANVPGSIWQGYVPSPYNSNDFLLKFDHQINAAHRFTGSYFETSGTNTVRAGTGNLPWAYQQFNWRQHNLNLSDVWVIDPTKINQAWITFTRNYGGRLNLPQTSLGDLGSAFTIQGTPSLPQITVSGFFTLTNAIGGPTAGGNFYSVRDVFSWTKGRHALKLGGEASLEKDIQDTLLNNYGVFTFNNSVTKNALADFLIGIPSAVTQDAPVRAYNNSWYTALFAQDDFRIHPRLTLNLGLRWDLQTPITDPQNRVDTYVAGQKSTVNPLAPAGQLFYGDPGVGRGVVPMRWHHVSPRVGLAWDPFGDGKTSIRAAGGIFYGSISGNEWNTMTNFEPFATRLTFTNTNAKTSAAGVPLGASLSNPYNAFVGGDPFPYKGTFVSGGGIFGIAQNFQWPYSYQLNTSIQRQVTKDLSITAAYVGSLFHDLPFARDVNYPVVTPTATSAGASVLARRPNPAFGAVLMMASDQTASYNGLQITAVKRMSRHVTFNTFYTFSKSMNSVELQNNTTQGLAQNYSNLREERAVADTDQRHVFGASVNYQPELLQRRQRHRAQHRERLGHLAHRQAAQRPSVLRHQRQRRRQPGRQHQRPRGVDRRSSHRQPHGGAVVQHRRVCSEQGRHRSRHRRQRGAQHPLRSGISHRRSGHLARLPFERACHAALPGRGHQCPQHGELRTAGQRRPFGRDIHHLRRDSHRASDAQATVWPAPELLIAAHDHTTRVISDRFRARRSGAVLAERRSLRRFPHCPPPCRRLGTLSRRPRGHLGSLAGQSSRRQRRLGQGGHAALLQRLGRGGSGPSLLSGPRLVPHHVRAG